MNSQPTRHPAPFQDPVDQRGFSAPQSPMQDDGLGLDDLFRIISTRRRIIAGTAITIMLVVVAILSQLTPRYTASALVMIDPSDDKVVNVETLLSGLDTDKASIENQVQIIRSRSLAERVIKEKNLWDDPVLAPQPKSGPSLFAMVNPLNWFASSEAGAQVPLSDEERLEGYTDRFLRDLRVSMVGNSTAIRISYTGENPKRAARLANAVAENYVDDQLNSKFERTRRATSWLADRLEELAGQVQQAERAVEQYKFENNLTDTGDGGSLLNRQLLDLNAQLSEAQARVAEAEAKLEQANRLYSSGQSIDSITQVLNSPLISQLRQQEATLLRRAAELRNRYGARHPRMIEVEAEQQNLMSKIDEEVRRIIQQLRNEVEVNQVRYNALRDNLRTLENDAAGQGQARIRLRELERAAASTRQLYEGFLSNFKEAQGQEGIQTPDARVLSQAPVPNSPSFPQTKLIIALAAPASILMGFLLALVAERLDNGFRTAKDIEEATGLSNLASVSELGPRIKRSGLNVVDYVVEKPLSGFAESVRGFLTGLKLSDVDHPPKVIAITSAVPSEGKTTFAVTAARLAAKQGHKVVLVDADLRKPTVLSTMGFDKAPVGIVEYLLKENSLESVVRRDDLTNLDILPVAAKAGNPGDLLGSQRMGEMLTYMREHYDLVLIDTAPILPVHDTKHLLHNIDKLVFAVRWEQTPRNAVMNALKDLRVLNAPLAGTVLTRTHTKRHNAYAYGYYRYREYNKYYTNS